MTEINTEPKVTDMSEQAETFSAKEKRDKGSGKSILLVVLLLIVALLGAAFWYQQQQFQQARQQLTRQLEEGASVARQADEKARQALTEAQRQESRLHEIQNAIDTADAHLQSLEQALQIATDSGSDLMLLNDIDRLVVIAQQQLQLSSNVGNAIIALESAQSQLARANRPSFAALQQALNGDLDRLRAVVNVDFTLRTSQLDSLYTLLSDAPLQISGQLQANAEPEAAAATVGQPEASSPTPASPADEAWWKTSLDVAQRWSLDAWQSVKQDLHSLIEVRRVNDSAALLLSPDQTERLRDNMRLRVVTARLALLMRQPDVWKAELSMLEKLLTTRFDNKSAQVHQAISLVNSLAETPVAASLPTLDNVTRAIEAQREVLASSSNNGGSSSVDNEADDKKEMQLPNMLGQPEGNVDSATQEKEQGAADTPETTSTTQQEPSVDGKSESTGQILSSFKGQDLFMSERVSISAMTSSVRS